MYFKTKYTYRYTLHYGGITTHQSDFADVQNRCGLLVASVWRAREKCIADAKPSLPR